MKRAYWIVCVMAPAAACAQTIPPTSNQGKPTQIPAQGPPPQGTPPVIPKTPDVTVPPAVTLPGPPNVQPRQITADDAVAVALKNQPAIIIARANYIQARGKTLQARSGLFPQIALSGGPTYTNQFQGTQSIGQAGGTGAPGGSGASGAGSSTYSATASLSASQLLFDFNRTLDSLKSNEAAERSLNYTLTATQQVVASLVKQDYYTYQQDVGFVVVAQSNLSRAQDQFSFADAELKAGLGEPEDMVQAKTSVASAVIALTTAQATAESARTQLASEMGIDPRTPFVPQNAEEPAPPSATQSLTDLVDYALRHRPEIDSAREGVVSAQYGVSVAKKNPLPKFSLSASVSPRWETNAAPSDSFAVGIVVSWDIFDSGMTQGLVEQANGALDGAKGTLIQETNQVVQDVSQASIDLQSATNRITAAAQEVGNAEEYVRISTGRYRGGIGTFLDVITAEAALTSAQRDQVQAQFDLQKARVEINRAIGMNP